jgi:predicted outer membrane repeat protein
VRQSAAVRVFQIVGTTTINGITISGGRSINNAGGILNNGGSDLTLNDTTVTDNQALGNEPQGVGGGIYNASAATLTLNGSTVSANVRARTGGGFYNLGAVTLNNSTVSGNRADNDGGGIYTSDGTLTLNRSTLSGNQADRGGGILSYSDLAGASKTTVTNSTISGNTAGSRGGGIYNGNGLTSIEYSTITNNTAPTGAGSGVARLGNTFTRTEVLSSIVSANTSTDVDFVAGSGTNSSNSFLSKGFNLIGDGNATVAPNNAFNNTGDLASVANPGLNPLASNGGPTQTHALLPGSPAVDAGSNADCSLTDQRGELRNDGDANGSIVCDIGAFEKEAPPAPPVAKPDTYQAVKNKPLKVSAAKGVLKNDTGTKPFTAQLITNPK